MRNSLQYAVYKGTGGKFGAVQFNFQPPHYYHGKQKDFSGREALDETGRKKEGWKEREGAIFLEITSTKEGQKNVYDWENKVIMALSVNDMGKVLLGLNKLGDTEIMHDPNAKTQSAGQVKKWLNIKTSEQGALFRVSMSAGGEQRSHTVPLSPDEVVILRALLQRAVARALNW